MPKVPTNRPRPTTKGWLIKVAAPKLNVREHRSRRRHRCQATKKKKKAKKSEKWVLQTGSGKQSEKRKRCVIGLSPTEVDERKAKRMEKRLIVVESSG